MKKPILFAFIFAVVAAFFAYLYLADLEIKYKKMAEPVRIVVAVQRIPKGTAIQQNMLVEKQIPKEYAQPKSFQNVKELFTNDGATIYLSLNTIEENEQVLSTKISKISQNTGINNLIPEGKKALPIKFDMETSNVLAPGSSIDIFSTIDYSDIGRDIQKSVFAIAQNVLVLAVGSNYIGEEVKRQDDEGDSANIVTLAVSVEEAQKIIMALDTGNLKYVIRPAGDVEILNINPLKLSSMIKDISKIILQNNTKNSKQEIQNQKEVLEIINKYSRR